MPDTAPPPKRKRHIYDYYMAILMALQWNPLQSMPPTKLMGYVGLNWNTFKLHLKKMLELELIEAVTPEFTRSGRRSNPAIDYRITNKGQHILRILVWLAKELDVEQMAIKPAIPLWLLKFIFDSRNEDYTAFRDAVYGSEPEEVLYTITPVEYKNGQKTN